ncbi:guanine nucleotide exchange factor for Rab-3A isoform X2 [Vidua chalybeata]|uniref:guanine nucleotide exchange factor for Rab-3A isoform X2 n=1 Tax=Vidua chalybeata TaxID=81927 RepID=UPI0023A80584|nr:guanine nucleotide exchange factor for Rab-3A isoform X2 [Vidua chalybeata]XP_053802928.1 guanine nucleotide exchange factor for Rab-3A isoform X2 [Vidua chalybeata]
MGRREPGAIPSRGRTAERRDGSGTFPCTSSLPPRQVSFEGESQNPPAVGHWKPLMPSKGDKEEPESGCQDAGGAHEPQSTEQLNVSRLRSSSVEIREKGSEFLRDELHKAQKELKLKDKECERLSKVREQLEQELEELTASLFEEAHKMVREANTKQAAAEKQLREARGKIDMLQAEVTALKTLVITSTPSSPNRELHPQLQSPSKAGFRKGHGRNKSTSSAVVSAASQSVAPEPVSRECRESGFPALLSLLLCILPGKAIHITYEPGWQALGADASSFSSSRQVDSILFAEFQAWKESPTLDKSCSFLDRIYREDVGPCLDFTKQEEMCSEWPPQDLQAPDHAGGFWELLLHFPFLQGQDHSSVQLLHLHPLYPARPGEAGCGADVLGGHAAPEGDVSGQTWILSQRDVSRALSVGETAPGGRAWSAVPVLLPPTFPLPGARSKRHKFHLQLSHSSKRDWNAAAMLPLELGWPWLLQGGHPWTLDSPI